MVGLDPWEVWQTRNYLIHSIKSVLDYHVFPRHMVWAEDSQFHQHKSKFREDMSDEQVADAIVDGITYPTYEYTKYKICNSPNKGYKIYKR